MPLAVGLRTRVAASLGCLLTAMTLVGCTQSVDSAAADPTSTATTGTGPATTSSPSSTDATGSPSTASPSASATTTPPRSPGAGVTPGGGGTAGTGQIGQGPISYSSGITVSVDSATQFTPSSMAIGTVVGHTGVVLAVTISNGSTQPLDTAYLTVALRTGPELALAAQIFDAPNGYGSGLTGTIPPGQTVTGQYAFDLPASDLSTLNVLITPDLRSPSSAAFTGAASAAGGQPTATSPPPAA